MTYKYLKETKHLILSEKNIRRFFRAARKIIYLYYLIEYETEEFFQQKMKMHIIVSMKVNLHQIIKGIKFWF